MKMSPLEVSIRDVAVLPSPGQSFFGALKKLEISSFELLVKADGSFPSIVLEDGSTPFSLSNLSALQARLEQENVGVCALLLGTDFGGEAAQNHIQWAIESVRAAQQLGAPTVRIDTATANGELSPAQMSAAFVRAITLVLQATAESGVDLGIENHGRISNDPAWLDEIFQSVDDPRLGLTLDVGNLYWWGHPLSALYSVIEKLAPLARHTHFKSISYPLEMRETKREVGYEYGRYNAPVNRGDIDMKRVIGILRAAGYKRTLCLENEFLGELSSAERIITTRNEAQFLRDLQNS